MCHETLFSVLYVHAWGDRVLETIISFILDRKCFALHRNTETLESFYLFLLCVRRTYWPFGAVKSLLERRWRPLKSVPVWFWTWLRSLCQGNSWTDFYYTIFFVLCMPGKVINYQGLAFQYCKENGGAWRRGGVWLPLVGGGWEGMRGRGRLPIS